MNRLTLDRGPSLEASERDPDAFTAPAQRRVPLVLAVQLLAMWDVMHVHAHRFDTETFAAWSGATKDLLIGAGLEGDGEKYVITP